jgi:hypothetical protein
LLIEAPPPDGLRLGREKMDMPMHD